MYDLSLSELITSQTRMGQSKGGILQYSQFGDFHKRSVTH